ncbi:hypothetical protein NDU88_013291 [Pleurodeles waltl]|uniref:Uncharacterized protein n=1 Tax=Pleurodeles waltl TaxID=8319 RepID=A0AAV7R6U3_PLEWA|nr:hypothetical protein NDU88_013291 [Pleurodeles waltl]
MMPPTGSVSTRTPLLRTFKGMELRWLHSGPLKKAPNESLDIPLQPNTLSDVLSVPAWASRVNLARLAQRPPLQKQAEIQQTSSLRASIRHFQGPARCCASSLVSITSRAWLLGAVSPLVSVTSKARLGVASPL